MVDYALKDLFNKDSVHKDLIIEYGYFSYGIDWVVQGTITNKDLHYENFSLIESLCSEKQLRFGCCEASEVKFRVSNVFEPLKGKYIKVFLVLDGNTDNPFQVGVYIVDSDVPTADRNWRDITAYDELTKLMNRNPSGWYNTLWNTMHVDEISVKDFRREFVVRYGGVAQEDIELPNDHIMLKLTSYVEGITGKDMLNAICEINGCFARINRKGKLEYILLKQDSGDGLYPSDTLYPSENLYPSEPVGEVISKSRYKTCKYEDYVTNKIDKLQIRITEEDAGHYYPDTSVLDSDNVYRITGNFLIYGKTKEEMQEILQNIYDVIKNINYRPFSAECVGNLCREVGDIVKLSTRDKIVSSYVLTRTLKGIQTLKDTISSKGIEKYSDENQNSISKQITALKNSTNTLIRNSEETSSRIEAITLEQEAMSSEITQNAEEINLKVSKGNVSSQLSVEEDQISIVGNRLFVDTDNFELEDGILTTTGTDSQKTVLQNGRVHFYNGYSELGSIGGYSAAFDEMSVKLIAPEYAVRIGGVGYSFVNNGGNPYGLTQRHIFIEDVSMEDVFLKSLTFGNNQSFTEMSALLDVPNIQSNGGMYLKGSFTCDGAKNRAVKTPNHGTVGMNAFETTGAYFSDIGSGTISDGVCYVWIDTKFAETIDENHEYQVFLTRTSKETTDYVEKHKGYFVVHGEDNATFDWMITAKQRDYQDIRMENLDISTDSEIPYDMSIFYADNTSELVSESYMEQMEDNVDGESVLFALDYMETENAILESEE